jgi:hypothetical protein
MLFEDARVWCVRWSSFVFGIVVLVVSAGAATAAEDAIVNGTGGNDQMTLALEAGNPLTLEVRFGSVVVFSDALANLSSITINGLHGDDTLVVDYENGFFAVPTAFNGGGQATPAGDSLEVKGVVPGGGASSYAVGPPSGEGKSGAITTSTGALTHVIQFSGLEPITLVGAGGSLTVIPAAATTIITLSDDPADTAGPGGNVLTADGGMETVSFAGFNSFTTFGGAGSEAMTVTNLDPAPSAGGFALTSVTVDGGDGSGGADVSPDTITLRSLPATITANLRGDAGNDVIHLGSAANSLSGILGPVNVDGGLYLVGATISTVTVANGLTVTVTLPYGDNLWYHDEGNTSPAQYNLTSTTLNRDTTVAPVTYSNIETLRLNAGQHQNDIYVTSTAANANFLAGNNQADDFFITATAAGSIVGVTPLAGNDRVIVGSVGDGGSLTVSDDAGMERITVDSVGVGSSLKAQPGDGSDTIIVGSTGAGSATFVNGEAWDDVIYLRASAASSEVELHGGDDNDDFYLGSTTQVLDGILGGLSIDGGPYRPGSHTIWSVTANGLTVTRNFAIGNSLHLDDDGTTAGAQYNIDATTFDRDTTVAAMTYSNLQRFSLRAGHGANDINVVNTSTSNYTIHSWEGADDIDVTTTAAATALSIQPVAGIDAVDIAELGDNNMLSVFAGDNVDVTTTGTGCGLRINGSNGVDTVRIRDLGSGSALLSVAYGEDDSYTVDRSSATSEIELHGDDDDDVFAVGGPGLDSVLGGFSADGGAGTDSLTFDDSTDSSNNSYAVGDTSLVRTGSPSLAFGAVESLSLLGGTGQDSVVVDIDNPPSAVTTFFLDAGDETGTDGDTVIAYGSAVIDTTLLGGDPTSSPGDSLVYTHPVNFFAEFETLETSALAVSPMTIVFTGLEPGSPIACETIEVTNNGSIPFDWSATGCDVSPFSLNPPAPGGTIDPGVTETFDVCLDASTITDPTVVSCTIDFTSDDPNLTDLEIPVYANLGLAIPALGPLGVLLFAVLISAGAVFLLRRVAG